MARTSKRQAIEFTEVVTRNFPKATADEIDELLTIAARMHRRAEHACNYGLSERQEKNDQRDEQRVLEIVKGWTDQPVVRFNDDPRGFTVKIQMPDGSYNSFGGRSEGWGI